MDKPPPAGSRWAIDFSDLGHAYRPGRWIFRHYAARIEAGRVFAILGPNGCGKTTLLNLLLEVLRPTAGRVRVAGRTAFVPQLFEVIFDYSALEMVLMGRAHRVGLFSQPSAADEEAALQSLRRVGLEAVADRSFQELSGGQRQLVILARALVAEPEILILDEPTSSLDLKNQALVLDWMASLSRQQGLTVLFTTHQPQHALAVADAALLMMGQQSFVCGPANEVLTEGNLATLYGVPLKRLLFHYGGDVHRTLVPVLSGGDPRLLG